MTCNRTALTLYNDDSLFNLYCCLQKYKPFVDKVFIIVFAYVYLGKRVKIQKKKTGRLQVGKRLKVFIECPITSCEKV